jgi:hypothetical protein
MGDVHPARLHRGPGQEMSRVEGQETGRTGSDNVMGIEWLLLSMAIGYVVCCSSMWWVLEHLD